MTDNTTTQDSKVEDILNDGGILKEILKEGEGWEKPQKGTEVKCHYVGTLLDGTEFDSSRKHGKTFDFKVGEGRVIKGWEEVIKTMKLGEVARVTLTPEYAYGEKGHPPTIPEKATLVFEMELVSFTNEKDLTKDGGVMKKVLKEGEKYTTPAFESTVVVSYEGKLENGTVFDRVYNANVVIGEGRLIDGLEKAIESMKENEKAWVKIKPEYGFGDKGREGVPPKSTLIYEIELHSIQKAKETWDLKTFDEISAAALERKEQGNSFFQQQRIDIAVKKYEKSLKFWDSTSKFSDEEKEKAKHAKVPIILNLSLCYFKQNNFKKSLEQASKALEIEPKNVKAIYRRGLAYVETTEWDTALKDFDTCLELDPGNKAVAKAKQKVLKLKAKQDQKDKMRYKNLFSVIDYGDKEAEKNEETKTNDVPMEEKKDDNKEEGTQNN